MSGSMGAYCKAYYLKDLRAFPDWNEKNTSDENELNDDSVVYLHDNYMVAHGVYQDKEIIFDDISDKWITFCTDSLNFEIPEDIREANAKDEAEQASATSES